ncbi:hypothetical protein [endosymbiont 'TC1' of Trimyema compressum]|uniref:hypothetical protein n=1 Tax=endosymbiont 'TC1' of Trimyema compressum TaxID=243899 RepID=UPI0013924226|nr:hypothetical protein [endosymbiont 'TC1' of Trimyema compressum]
MWLLVRGNDDVNLKTLKAPNIENARHFKVYTTGSGTVTFKALKLVGFNTISGTDVTRGTTAGDIEISGVQANPYNLFVDNCIIEGVTSGGAIGIGYNGNKVTISNSSFIGNIAVTSGAVINVDGPKINLLIDGCIFIGNKGSWPGYKGGTILLKGNDRDVVIKNSMFYMNNHIQRGGAVGLDYCSGNVTIHECIFENNFINNVTSSETTAEGGVLAFLQKLIHRRLIYL